MQGSGPKGMDSYREYPSEFDVTPASDNSSSPEPSGLEIGSDERRMHVRAYNYWVGLLNGRDYPSIEDLEPGEVSDFAAHSVLLDFTAGRDNPATPYIGSAIREECGLGEGIKSIEEVPSRSLLSRLTLAGAHGRAREPHDVGPVLRERVDGEHHLLQEVLVVDGIAR